MRFAITAHALPESTGACPEAVTATAAAPAAASASAGLRFAGAVEFSRPRRVRREAGIGTFNEMFDGEQVRPAYARLVDWVESTSPEVLAQKKEEAEALFRRIGITFAVYGEGGDTERLIPFDMMPRVFTEAEWRKLERGVKQRARALNAFLYDVYHRAEIVRAGVIPADLVFRNEAYEPAVVGIDPPGGVYSHIVGIDLVRTGPEDFFVLEDNCRTPSGVSYMLENREIMMRMFPELFRSTAHRAGRRLSRPAAPDAGQRRAGQVRGRAGQRGAVARARSTAPTTSIRSSPTRWASSWSRGRISSCRATSSTCAPPRGRSGST